MTDDPGDPEVPRVPDGALEGAIDDLLSADLDGETTPSEHDRIESDPELRARREELRRTVDLLSRPPTPLTAASADGLIARALAASDADGLAPPVVPLAPPPRGAMSRPRWQQTPLLVAAAIVVLMAIGVGLIVTATSSHHNTDTAAEPRRSTKSQSADNRKAAGAAPKTTAANNPREVPPAASAVGFIGRFSSPAALRLALRIKFPPLLSPSSPGAPHVTRGQADRCAAVVEARDPGLTKPRVRSAAALVGSQPVVVLEYRARALTSNRLTTRVIAVGVAACDERVNFER